MVAKVNPCLETDQVGRGSAEGMCLWLTVRDTIIKTIDGKASSFIGLVTQSRRSARAVRREHANNIRFNVACQM